MSAQPEALRLADWIVGEEFYGNFDPFINDKMDKVKAELRRLHEVNQELVEALKWMLNADCPDQSDVEMIVSKAQAALDKATGESNDTNK